MTDASMRVLHVVTASSPNPLLMDVAHGLRSAGVEMIVASVDAEGELQAEAGAAGFQAFALGAGRRAGYPGAALRLARRLRAQPVQVVHTHTTEAALIGLTAARLARVPAAVSTRHHSDERRLYPGWKGRLADRVIGRWLSHEVIALGPGTAQALREIDGVPAEKIRLVPNGYVWSRVRPSAGGPDRVRRELGLEGRTVLCTVGRLFWIKGYDTLLWAIARADLQEDVRLLVVGLGADEPAIRRLAGELGVADRCVFAGFRKDIFDVLTAADLVVHPSRNEAQCQVIIEALALERPVVATDVGMAAEVIVPGQSGWLVPPDDPAALADAIREALASPELRARYAAVGRTRVLQAYPIERMVGGYVAGYHLLVDRGRSGQRDARVRARLGDPDLNVGVRP